MQIEITVENRECRITGAANALVCDNSGDMLHFAFDAEWSGYAEKIVYFVGGADGLYIKSLMNGDTVEVPMIPVPGHLIVGVQAGNIRTTRDVVIDVKPSIRTRLYRPAAEVPQPLEAQILARMDELEEQIGTGGGGVTVSYDADTGDLTITSTGSGSSVVYDDETGNLQIA